MLEHLLNHMPWHQVQLEITETLMSPSIIAELGINISIGLGKKACINFAVRCVFAMVFGDIICFGESQMRKAIACV